MLVRNCIMTATELAVSQEKLLPEWHQHSETKNCSRQRLRAGLSSLLMTLNSKNQSWCSVIQHIHGKIKQQWSEDANIKMQSQE